MTGRFPALLALPLLLCLWLQPLTELHAQRGSVPPADSAAIDSLAPFPKKLPSRSTWEHVVSLPGTILYAPFWAVFETTKAGIVYYQESDQLAWLRRLLRPKIRISGVVPTYSTRAGVGLRYYHDDFFGDGSRLAIKSQYGITDARTRHYIRGSDVPLAGQFFFGRFEVEYEHLTSESFFGFGPQASFNNELDFAHERTTLDARLGVRLAEKTALVAVARYEHNNIFDGTEDDLPKLPQGLVPGAGSRIKIGTIGAMLDADTRTTDGRPLSGWEVRLGGSLSDQVGGDQFRFYKIGGDVRRYFHLFYGRTMMLRLAAERTWPLDGKEIPFYYLSELGREETLRGYTRGRFRDRDLLLAVLEYRYPIYHFFDFALFIDAGQVSPDLFQQFAWRHFSFGFGAGVRVITSERLLLNAQIGFSGERVRLYLELN